MTCRPAFVRSLVLAVLVLMNCQPQRAGANATPVVNSFANISSNGGTARAGSSHDTLHLVGAGGTTVTINPSAKTVTFRVGPAYFVDGSPGFTNLSTAKVSIGSTPATLQYAVNQTINTLTIPANIQLQPVNGAVITVNSGKTLTINGPFSAPPTTTCFTGAGIISINNGGPTYAAWGGGVVNSRTGNLIALRVLTTSGTYTPTPGTTLIIVEMIGGGGGGGGTTALSGYSAAGAGGTAGGYAKWVYLGSPPAAIAYTIGAGGAGGVSGATGATGGYTSFDSPTVSGGGGGGGMVYGATPGQAQSAGPTADSYLNFLMIFMTVAEVQPGMSGNPGIRVSGGSVWSGSGGNSQFGAGGKSVVFTDANGAPGVGCGSGGAGAVASGATNRTGGAGKSGIIYVWEY
jgi:hypothetical protein